VGDTINLTWDVRGVQYVLIEVNNAITSAEPEAVFDHLPLTGTTIFQVPSDFQGIWFTVYGVNRTANGVAERVVNTALYVRVNIQSASAFTVQAAYQTYDNGFMIWRADTGDVYVFYNTFQLELHSETIVCQRRRVKCARRAALVGCGGVVIPGSFRSLDGRLHQSRDIQ
jgi:hypothetical protein